MNEKEQIGRLSSFIEYRKVLYNLVSDLRDLKEFSADLGLLNSSELIEQSLRRIEEDSFSVAIVGEFKRGKSTFINALLGKAVLPSDVLPCSATLNRITYGLQPSISVKFKDGSEEEVEIDRLADYVTRLTSESEEVASRVSEAVVKYPVHYCQNNVDIIDTPGLNDDDNMTAVTLSVLPTVDTAILVISALSPFGEYERDFLENKILTSDLGRVVFVVNHIDRLNSAEDADRIVVHIEQRIQRYVMKRAEERCGNNSAEYEVYLKKIGRPRVFGVSAYQALVAKESDDSGLLEKSRFPIFESALERFLSQERGAVFLQVPVNRIIASSAEILGAIQREESALAMRDEEFEAAYTVAAAEIAAIRSRQEEELRLIDESAERLKLRVAPLVDGIAGRLKSAARDIVDRAVISPGELKDADALSKGLGKKVSDELQNVGQKEADRIQVEIEAGVLDEVSRLQDFTAAVARAIDRVQVEFVGVRADTVHGDQAGQTAAAVLAGFTGLGGIWSGYREAGAKGAAVGAAASFGTCFAGGFALALLGLPIAWPAVIALGVVSIFTGGWLTRAVFGKARAERFKESFLVAAEAAIEQQLQDANMPGVVNSHIERTFKAIQEKLSSEVNSQLDDLQRTLEALRSRRERQQALSAEEKKNLEGLRAKVDGMLGNAQRLSTELVQILSV